MKWPRRRKVEADEGRGGSSLVEIAGTDESRSERQRQRRLRLASSGFQLTPGQRATLRASHKAIERRKPEPGARGAS